MTPGEYQGLRITPNVYTTLEEIDTFTDVMEDHQARLDSRLSYLTAGFLARLSYSCRDTSMAGHSSTDPRNQADHRHQQTRASLRQRVFHPWRHLRVIDAWSRFHRAPGGEAWSTTFVARFR